MLEVGWFFWCVLNLNFGQSWWLSADVLLYKCDIFHVKITSFLAHRSNQNLQNISISKYIFKISPYWGLLMWSLICLILSKIIKLRQHSRFSLVGTLCPPPLRVSCNSETLGLIGLKKISEMLRKNSLAFGLENF